jgi:hypothetical protein
MAALCFTLGGSASAQASAQINNPLSSVREDIKESSVVARVSILDTKLGACDDYACEFKVFSRVGEVYKGSVRSGQLLNFSARADKGFEYNKLHGDFVVFLTSFINRKKGPFQILPDYFSIHEYSQELVAKIRRISRTSHRSN